MFAENVAVPPPTAQPSAPAQGDLSSSARETTPEFEVVNKPTNEKTTETAAGEQDKDTAQVVETAAGEQGKHTTMGAGGSTSAHPKDVAGASGTEKEHIFYQHQDINEEDEDPIRPGETAGDYYYRSYKINRAGLPHEPIWKLKQGDAFID